MPKISSSHCSKIKCWVEKYPELKTEGKIVFCTCNKAIGCEHILKLKHILSDRRHNFKEKNLEMYMIINFNQIL